MSSIKSFIEGYMTGNAWEDLCVRCYRIRYQKDNYTAIPATQGGDAGIEGFTYKGVVHQCYCPERDYSDNELYEHQRNKLTADIEKLKKNADRLKALGVPPVVEWHFNIPEYKDTRILAHAESKRQEVIKAKKDKPSDYTHIADDFQIVIKTAEDFAPEISCVIRTSLSDMRLNLAIEHSSKPDWSKCDSEKVANIRRKIKAIMLVDDADEALNEVVGIYVDCYISGLEILNDLRVCFPEIYEEIYRLEQSYKREVSIRTLMNTDKTMNRTLFDAILNEFHSKLERDFSSRFNEASIGELKQDLIASWLADCSGDVCSLIKLHMISFALISQENMRKLVDFADGIGSAPIVRFDPSVNRALTYAIGYGLIKRQQNAKYKLTGRGKQLAEQIKVVGDLMVIEIGDLNLLAKKLTERKVEEIVDRWRIKDAEDQ